MASGVPKIVKFRGMPARRSHVVVLKTPTDDVGKRGASLYAIFGRISQDDGDQ
jgi:hypothetical protein